MNNLMNMANMKEGKVGNIRKLSKKIEMDRVYKTDDYSIFKTIPTNRNISQSQLSKLAKSIKAMKQNYNAICVTKDLYVVDGEHRLHGCQLAGIPVSYIIREFPSHMSNEDLMIELNVNGRNWTTGDYVVRNAKRGISGYDVIIKLMKDHGVSFGLLVDLGIAPSSATPKKGIPIDIKLEYGDMVLRDYFRLLNEFKLIFSGQKLTNTQNLARAFKNVLKAHSKYESVKRMFDENKMVRDLIHVKKKRAYPPTSEPEFRAMLADALDYYVPLKDKVGEEIRSINDKQR